MQLHNTKQLRPGFTLVELAVVIGIISLLAAALLPAIYGAVTRAKEARILIELAAIGKSLERYKLEYGEYPPDFAELAYMNAAGATDVVIAGRAQQIIDGHLSRTFRRRSDRDYPRLVNGSAHVELLANLNPRNAMAFWLGGFTNDPSLPLSGATARTPIHEFDKSRFSSSGSVPPAFYVQTLAPTTNWTDDTVDTANSVGFVDGYYPSGDATNTSFVYYRAPESGYDWAVNWVGELISNNDPAPPSPPFQSTAITGYAAPQKFQLISAGLDGDHGVDPSTIVDNPDPSWEWKLSSPNLASRKTLGSSDNLCTAWDGSNLEDYLDQ